MAKKKIVRSRDGLTNCPSCLAHINLGASLEQVDCPFCGANLVQARLNDGDVFGQGVMGTLRVGRSSMLAAALGASLTMTACDLDNEPDTSKDIGISRDMPHDAPAGDMYGQSPVDFGYDIAPDAPAGDMYGQAPADLGFDQDPSVDASPEADLSEADMSEGD